MRQELVPGIDADLSLELTALDGLRVERKHGGTVRLKLCSGREHRAPHAVARCVRIRRQRGYFEGALRQTTACDEFHTHIGRLQCAERRCNAQPQALTARHVTGRIVQKSQHDPRPGLAHTLLPIRERLRSGKVALGKLRVLARGGAVKPLRVVVNHAPRIEARNHARHRALAAPHPLRRAPIRVARIIKGHHFLLDSLKDEIRLERIAPLRIASVDRRNPPAVVGGAGLAPPTIQHAQVEAPVHGRLHP